MSLPRRPRGGSDEGTTLIIVLVFITVVGLLLGAFLDKAGTVARSGGALRDRTMQQYALDAGIERAFQVLRADIRTNNAQRCFDAAAGTQDLTSVLDGSGLEVNGHSVSFSCQTLGGSARTSGSNPSNYAVVAMDSAIGAFSTYGSGSGSLTGATCGGTPTTDFLRIDGSIYTNSSERLSDFSMPLLLCNGDWAQQAASTPACSDANYVGPSSLIYPDNSSGKLALQSTHLAACSEQTATDAAGPTPSLPASGLATSPDVHGCVAQFNEVAGVLVFVNNSCSGGSGGAIDCRVFYPGHYTDAPSLGGGSADFYFASGDYYFDGIGDWSPSANIVAGAVNAAAGDVGLVLSATKCAGMTDALASTSAPAGVTYPIPSPGTTGVQWLLGGNSQITAAGGKLTLNSKSWNADGSAPATALALGEANGAFSAWVSGGGPLNGLGSSCSDGYALCNQSTAELHMNGKVYMPSAPVKIWSANPSLAAVNGGIVGLRVALGANVGGSGSNLVLSAPTTGGSPPPPFRTIRVLAVVDGTAIRETALVTISNFSPYSVDVRSWRVL